jgi:hypothetical protein
MHHPTRRDGLARLIEACRPLTPRVVVDPNPSGPPSPLRTAKLAWLAVAPDATHHLVLQDDVVPVAGFASHLERALTAQANAAVALYVNWNSPFNSYLVRLAAVLGSQWAWLTDREFAPTLGLVLPAAIVSPLAERLAGAPDEFRHDDKLVAAFCRERSVPIVATVPQLLEHAGDLSVAGNQRNGLRLGTIQATSAELAATDWTINHALSRVLAQQAADLRLAVVLRRSLCSLRLFVRALHEDVESPFTWRWLEGAALLGLDSGAILSAFAGHLRQLGDVGQPADVELWAACHLLGRDAASCASGLTLGHYARQAVASWINAGLEPRDAARAGSVTGRRLLALGMAALRAGMAGSDV